MENHIILSQVKTTGLHFGSQSGYERFKFSHFEKNSDNFIDKLIINSVKYQPDTDYNNTDGYFGTCWIAEMIETNEISGYVYYHFRNFEDIVGFYLEKGYKFIDMSE